MVQSIKYFIKGNFADILKILKVEAEFAHKYGSYISSLSCAPYFNGVLGKKIHTTVIYSEGDFEQDFHHFSAESLEDLKCCIDNTATRMSIIGYKITAITHACIQKSKLQQTFEAIVIFSKHK